MARLRVCWLALGLACGSAAAQSAQDLQPAAPAARAGETTEQHGRRLLDEMVAALGGDAWLNKTNVTIEGQTAAFFQGQPTGSVVRFLELKRFATAQAGEATRVEFLTTRGMIAPGMKRDVVHLWANDNGYEQTYKGRTELPAEQVKDYNRRRDHSLEELMRTWVKAPGVAIVYEGHGMRDRRPVDKVTVLSANNDAVTVELEEGTHLPLERSYEWRNQQFQDHDVEEEVYGDWRMYDGVETPMNVTLYRNGDMISQTFYTKVRFNQTLAPELFDPGQLSAAKASGKH